MIDNNQQQVPPNQGVPQVADPFAVLQRQITLTKYVKESVQKSHWAEYDRKSTLSNEVYLQSWIHGVTNSSAELALICAADDDY